MNYDNINVAYELMTESFKEQMKEELMRKESKAEYIKNPVKRKSVTEDIKEELMRREYMAASIRKPVEPITLDRDERRNIINQLAGFSDIRMFIPDMYRYIVHFFDCSSYYNDSHYKFTHPVFFEYKDNQCYVVFRSMRSSPINRIIVNSLSTYDGITLTTYHDNAVYHIKATWKTEFL